jgi:hypothetical protein
MLEKQILLYSSSGRDLRSIVAEGERNKDPAFPNEINPHLLKM